MTVFKRTSFNFFALLAGINARECALIGACWRDSPRGGVCVYPSDTQGRPTVRSSNDAESDRVQSSSLFGLPVCYPLDASSPASDFLSNYHTCLSSGCASNVDRQTLFDYLLEAGSHLQFPINLQYINMVHSGLARPDNYREVLENLLRPTIPHRPGPYGPPTFPPIFPFNLNVSGSASVNTNSERGLFTGNAQSGLGGGFPPIGGGGHPPSGGFPPIGVFPPGPYPPQPPIDPCPYNLAQVNTYGLPQLTGSFLGCCDRPLCYIPKPDLYGPISGISPYLSQWSEWSDCNADCGGGIQNRTRRCISQYGDCDPNALLLQTRSCNAQPCPYYGNWGRWGVCSATCGGGTRSRSRVCQGVGSCDGPATESQPCRTGRCPIFRDGEWSSCSNTCGRGTRRRERSCTDGGAYGCPPNTADEGPCEQFCGTSSVTCNTGTCCWEQTCRQFNNRPGYCLPDNRAGTRCYEGFCGFNTHAVCGSTHVG